MTMNWKMEMQKKLMMLLLMVMMFDEGIDDPGELW